MASSSAVLVMPIPPVIFASLTMPLTIIRSIFIVIPSVIHKIDRAPTSAILVAVSTPMLLMARRHTEIHWLNYNISRYRLNDHGFRPDQPGTRCVTDIDLPIEVGLADVDGDIYAGECRESCRG